MSDAVRGLTDHLFRHSAGQMVATLTRVFGAQHVSLAEEVVQDALVTALQQWPLGGIPAKPSAWLFQVARNKALDQIRRHANLRGKESEIVAALATAPLDDVRGFAHELQDDQLRMMLMCCHPAIPAEARIALTLKTVGGFSVDEIARAFLAKREAIAQRLVRAKRLIRDEAIAFAMPSRAELAPRLQSLLTVLYLMFNEGYSAHAGEDLVRRDLCAEAIRLARIVADHPVAGHPAADALLALMLLQGARLPARIDAAGELMTLAEQDRALWDRAMIGEGMRRLDRSAEGDELTAFHIEAGIASCHSTARTFEETPWDRVVELYDARMDVQPSPVVALNRAVAVAMRNGPETGIAAIEQIASSQSLRDYLPLASTLGELCLRAGERARAAEHFRRALSLPGTGPEKRFLMRKLEAVLR
jgi:RNA polymerase sigma-70 factor (ECF subfamily)